MRERPGRGGTAPPGAPGSAQRRARTGAADERGSPCPSPPAPAARAGRRPRTLTERPPAPAPHSHRAPAEAAPLHCGCRHRAPLLPRPRGRDGTPTHRPTPARCGADAPAGRAGQGRPLRSQGLGVQQVQCSSSSLRIAAPAHLLPSQRAGELSCVSPQNADSVSHPRAFRKSHSPSDIEFSEVKEFRQEPYTAGL